MFADFLENGEFDAVIESAKKSPHIKLSPYKPAYDLVNDYCSEHGLLINKHSIITSSKFTLYGTDIFRHSVTLANKLTEVCPYVKMDTDVKNKEFTIWIDSMKLINLFCIDVNTMEIMSEKCENLKYLTPDIELMLIYYIMSDPSMFDVYDDTKDREKILWKKMKTFGGKKKIIKKHINSHTDVVLDWLKTKPIEYAIVSESGVSLFRGKHPKCARSIQFITDDLTKAIDSLKRHIFKNTGIKVGSKIANANVIGDWRLKKATVFFTDTNDRRQYVCDIYNSLSYDVVPRTMIGGFSVANPIVLIRFLFINMWFAKVMKQKGIAGQEHYMKETFECINDIHKSIYETSENFPDFIGTYINEFCSKKMSNNIMPYYPISYKNKNGSFMLIS